jgi:putative Mg2+ transporter-C (MgtC) family protein
MTAWWEVLLRLALATVLGGLIGWERETRGKPAGLRTMMLVAVSAAVFVLGAQEAAAAMGDRPETVRAMVGIAQGIGFLGAGAILQSKGEVLWLTTAAALWAAAALGMAAAMGTYLIAIAGGAIVFVILRCVAPLERRYIRPAASAKPAKGPKPRAEQAEKDEPSEIP